MSWVHDRVRWIVVALLLVPILAILLLGVGFSVRLLWILGAVGRPVAGRKVWF